MQCIAVYDGMFAHLRLLTYHVVGRQTPEGISMQLTTVAKYKQQLPIIETKKKRKHKTQTQSKHNIKHTTQQQNETYKTHIQQHGQLRHTMKQK